MFDIPDLAEDSDLECKRAAGRDGQGELPRDFWQSYVAMANTDGGTILLGVEQRNGAFRASGIESPSKVLKALWDGLNNPQQVSVNLLSNESVRVVESGGAPVIRVDVPRAKRRERPVHVGMNPMTGTYRRNYEGDYRCDEETVRRMIAERVEDVRDARLLESFGFEDLERDSLRSYRHQFRAAKPGHPWSDSEDRDFLRSLGAWTVDRADGREGLTLAGLLMFGRLPSILEAVPNYVVDYQEWSDPKAETRWIDRLTTDGTWSGNLYDFYRRVIQKLTSDLKVPFRLEGATRVDETTVHEALREALVNALVHADYTGRVSILIVKRPDLFSFRNPGTMRLPLTEALRGGTSDCRNRTLQKMFQLAGFGEQAGSGIPKIFRSWNRQHWRAPDLVEQVEPDQTVLTLRMMSLLPEKTLEELDTRFGPRFRRLPETQRLALATVAIEGTVTHSRLRSMCSDHRHDLTLALSSLVKDGFLGSAGATRGKYYFFPGEPPLSSSSPLPVSSEHLGGQLRAFGGGSSEHLASDRPHLPETSEHLTPSSEHLEEKSPELWLHLLEVGKAVRGSGKAPKEEIESVILEACRGGYLTLRELSQILGRSENTIRQNYLSGMTREGRIVLRHPQSPQHPNQAYTARK